MMRDHRSVQSGPGASVTRLRLLATSLLLVHCAETGPAGREPLASELPSTQEELRIAIDEDRSRVMNLLANEDAFQPESIETNDEMTELGERLMQLQEALNELENQDAKQTPAIPPEP